MRKTKIICSLGPASGEEAVLRRMMEAGMDVARFNFSHGTHAEHLARFQLVDRLRRELCRPVGAMLDTKGPEIRLGVFENGPVVLAAGQLFTLTPEPVPGSAGRSSITYRELGRDVRPGDRLLIDDGRILSDNLRESGHDRKWLEEELRRRNLSSPAQVFLFTVDAGGNTICVPREVGR